jgi:2'-5' RNA ligase
MQADRVRVFVALAVPESVRKAIAGFIAKLRRSTDTARWARLEGLHVTLKFIGEVPPEKIAAIAASLAQIPFRAPIEIKFRNVGFFPNQKRPLVFWAGIEAGPELPALADAVNTSLEPLSIAREKKTFAPHLTLARFKPVRGTPKLDTLHKAIAAAGSGVIWSAVFPNKLFRPSFRAKRGIPLRSGLPGHGGIPRFARNDGFFVFSKSNETTTAAAPLEFGGTLAKEFHLYQSILKPGGAEYTRLATFGCATGDPQ